MSDTTNGNPDALKALILSKRLIYFGLAIGAQGFCFHIMHWGYSLYFFLVATSVFLAAFLVRLTWWKTLGYQCVLWSLSAFALGARYLFVTQHLPGSEFVAPASLVVIGVTLALELFVAGTTDKTADLNGWIKAWIGMIAFALLLGSAFKIMHWPGANMLLVVSLQNLSLLFLLKAKDPGWGTRK